MIKINIFLKFINLILGTDKISLDSINKSNILNQIKMTSVQNTTDHLETTLPLGYSMLQKMGWKENTPLGLRQKGIMVPITDSMDIRLTGDYRGLGFQPLNPLVPPLDDEEKGVDIKVTKVGERYGVGVSYLGEVFISTGTLKHLNNVTGYTRHQLVGLRLMSSVSVSDGRFPWRIQKVEALLSNPLTQPITFVGYNPIFNGSPYVNFEVDCGMDVMDHLF